MWLHVNNCCKEAVVHSYQEEAITGIMFCHQTGGHITGWAYNQDLRGGGGGGGGLYKRIQTTPMATVFATATFPSNRSLFVKSRLSVEPLILLYPRFYGWPGLV